MAGVLLGISLAAPPGPVMAVIASASARGKTRQSIATGVGAITGDAIWLTLVLIGFLTLLQRHLRLVGLLGLLGAALLLWMAWESYRIARRGPADSDTPGSYRLGLLAVLTSPFSFAWWMASGPMLIQTLGAPGIAGLFLSLFAYVLAITYALRWLGKRVARTALVMAYASAALLALFGVYFAIASFGYLSGTAA